MRIRTTDASKKLGVHPSTLRKWANAGMINFYRKSSSSHRYFEFDECTETAKKRNIGIVLVPKIQKANYQYSKYIASLHQQYPMYDFVFYDRNETPQHLIHKYQNLYRTVIFEQNAELQNTEHQNTELLLSSNAEQQF